MSTKIIRFPKNCIKKHLNVWQIVTKRYQGSFLGDLCSKKEKNVDEGPNKTATIKLENAFKLYNFKEEPSTEVCLSRKDALYMYKEMVTVRRLENACATLYTAKLIRGFCHLYDGQEACAVGIKSVLRPQDTVITSYRAHGWTYLMGVSAERVIGELMQKFNGCSRGKGGSMHMYAANFFGGNGIVGSQCPVGTGLAFSHAYRCTGGVSFTCYGDGASNQGQLFESINIACLWKLPVVFVCENNKYGMGTSVQRSSCNSDYYTRGDYIPGLWVNGMDVLAVRSAAEFCIKHVTSCGPMVLELETYRYHGHSMSDPGVSYRKREEVQMMRSQHDPIMKFREIILKMDLAKEQELKKIDDDIKNAMDETLKVIKTQKEPDLSELTADIYLNNIEPNVRGILYRNLKHKKTAEKQFIPLGMPKATPKSQINEPEPPKKQETNAVENKSDAKQATKNSDSVKKKKSVDTEKKA